MERCRRESGRLNRRFTVRERLEMAKRGQKAVLPTWTPEELAKRAQSIFIDQGGPVPEKAHWRWQRNAKMVAAMEVVLAACAAAGADPDLYVQAQVESVGIVGLAHGRNSMLPGCFHGANADARFERWMARKNHKRASLTRHREDEALAEKRLAASAIFGESYLAGGADKADAIEAARELLPDWVLGNQTEVERWTSLVAGCDAAMPGLSNRVLAPEGWTFSQARTFISRVTEHEATCPAKPVVAEGEDELGSFA